MVIEGVSSDIMSRTVIATARHLDTHDNDQPEPFRVEVEILWPDFKAVVMAQYEVPPSDVVIKYADEDNEMITMTSQEELQEAIKLAEDNNGIIQLEVKKIEKKKTLLQLGEEAEQHVNASLIMPAIPRRKPIPSLRLSMAEKLANAAVSSNQSKSHEMKPEMVGELPKATEKKEKVERKIESYTLEIDGEQTQENHADYEKMAGSNIAPAMPYPEFVEFMEKLKQELRTEIVHDVTKKTVKQVMRGFDTSPIKKQHRDPWSIGREDIKHAHPIYLHEGIVCNNCQKTILGCRYKCGNCVDYDLCEQCESKYGIHNIEHVFIKLRRPCKEMLYRDGKKTPLLKRVLYKTDTGSDSLERIVERKREKMKKKAEKMIEKEKKKEEKLKRKLEKYEGLKDSPMKRERYEKVPSLIYQHFNQDHLSLGASFIRDITIPDGTNVQPGTKMLKTWRLLNSGSVAWKDSFKLRLMYGTIPADKTEVSVPCLQPGEEGDVTAELTAPEKTGRYQSHWKLFDGTWAFGHRVWVMINVVPREVLEPKSVESLRMVTLCEEEKKEVVKTQAPEEQTVVRDIEAPVSSETDVPLYRLIPAMLDEVEEIEQPQPLAIVSTQPSAINDLNKQDSVKEESLTSSKIECIMNLEADTVELNLNSAVAAMEKLTVSEPVDVPSTKTSKDLLSFEFLDRTPPKISQTATPNNTPLDVSPPKSPITTPRLETVLSASSSMELVNGDNDECTPLLAEYPHERIQSLELRPDILDDVESLESYSDDDSSCSDDFFLVPLPDCFDTSKPLTRSSIIVKTETDDMIETENQSEDSESSPSASQLTVDDMLQVSTNVDTRPLTPEVTSPEIVRDVCETEASAGVNEEVTQGLAESEGAVGEQISTESPILDSACYASASGRPLTEEEHETQVLHLDPGCSQAAERTVPPPVSNVEDGAEASAVAAATAEQQEFAKQLLDVAVTAAANAASHAFYKVKDVFNTWQAKDQERKQQQQKIAQNIKVAKERTPPKVDDYLPPSSEWTPPKNTFVPPKSDWSPPVDTYVPPQSTWTPPPQDTQPMRRETTPMDRLLEMGFADRSLNLQLLEEYDNDVNQVISVIIDMHKEDWAGRRH